MTEQYDVALIGGGIMSATLGVLLKEINPAIKVVVFERLDALGLESSDAWNNAGTGHAAYCELNYTPLENGEVQTKKALKISEQFEVSKQFWAYLLENHKLINPSSFINQTPHCSFVKTAEDVVYLRKRWEALHTHHFFAGMKYTENPAEMAGWFPLMMAGRDAAEPLAATYMAIGTDINFGNLTRDLFVYLDSQQDTKFDLHHEVNSVERQPDGLWHIDVEDLFTKRKFEVKARLVFVGAGGGALELLNKADIRAVDGYGGFPVGGQWLRCKNPAVVEAHDAKVYSTAEVGSPPMSVPHLDTRIIDGQRELLFGPYAGFNTKFLKEGSYADLLKSIDLDNIVPMVQAGVRNISLTKYLIEQVLMSFEKKFEFLKGFYPTAQIEDWELVEAGQRVQIIKRDENGVGDLEFGTEILAAEDGTLAGLLGASPGASTAVSAMLTVAEKFQPYLQCSQEVFDAKIREMIPSYGISLAQNAALTEQLRQKSHPILGIA